MAQPSAQIYAWSLRMKNDLATAMVLTGVSSLDKVTRKILA